MRLVTKYTTELRSALGKELSIGNQHAVPALSKIVLNIGTGSRRQQQKFLDIASEDLARMTGQKPVITKAKKSIASFKLRQGNPIGVMVTLPPIADWPPDMLERARATHAYVRGLRRDLQRRELEAMYAGTEGAG